MTNRLARCCGLVLPGTVIVVLCGCFGYRLGSTLPSDIKTVHVPTFLNKSSEPQLEGETSRAAVEEFQKDGTLRIAGADQADSVVEVTLLSCKLEPVRFEKDNRKTPSEYRMRILAEVVFKRARSGDVLLKPRKIEGETTFVPVGDLSSSKQSALPKAARDLAHKIVVVVAEYW